MQVLFMQITARRRSKGPPWRSSGFGANPLTSKVKGSIPTVAIRWRRSTIQAPAQCGGKCTLKNTGWIEISGAPNYGVSRNRVVVFPGETPRVLIRKDLKEIALCPDNRVEFDG